VVNDGVAKFDKFLGSYY